MLRCRREKNIRDLNNINGYLNGDGLLKGDVNFGIKKSHGTLTTVFETCFMTSKTLQHCYNDFTVCVEVNLRNRFGLSSSSRRPKDVKMSTLDIRDFKMLGRRRRLKRDINFRI